MIFLFHLTLFITNVIWLLVKYHDPFIFICDLLEYKVNDFDLNSFHKYFIYQTLTCAGLFVGNPDS